METVVYDSFFGAVFKSLATLETERFQNVPFLKGSIIQLNRFRKPFVFTSVVSSNGEQAVRCLDNEKQNAG